MNEQCRHPEPQTMSRAAARASTRGAQRGRPRSEEKRREIMQAAIDLFTERGYEHTSVDDIAAAAGVSKQTVYSHYGSKENLFGLAVSTRCKQSGIDEDSIDLDAPPGELLPRLAEQFLELVMSPSAKRVYAVCTGSADTHPELGALFFEHGPRQTVRALARYFEAQTERGALCVDDPEHAAWQYLGMLKAEAQMRVQFNMKPLAEREIRSYLKSCVDVFLRAYTP
jgi:AcrR family transcriptional regulator